MHLVEVLDAISNQKPIMGFVSFVRLNFTTGGGSHGG